MEQLRLSVFEAEQWWRPLPLRPPPRWARVGLWRLRAARHLTLEALAAGAGLSTKSTPLRWERGAKRPTPERLPVLAGLFGVPVAKLKAAIAETRRARENEVARRILARTAERARGCPP